MKAAFQRGGIDQLGLVQPQFATDHFITGLFISGNVDVSHLNEGAFFGIEYDDGRLRVLIGTDIRVHLGKCIPFGAVQIGDARHFIPHLGHADDRPLFKLAFAPQLGFGKKSLPLVVSLGELELRAFYDREADGKPLFIRAEIHGGAAHLRVEISFVEIGLSDSLDIVGELILLIDPRVVEP